MKIIKVSTCEECPEYSHHEYDLPYCMKSERGIVYDDNPFPSWCPLEDAPEPPRPNDTVCPECGGKLSTGLSADKWVCIECGLLSREYYKNK